MISRDSRCVYVGDYLHEIALVIALLAEGGIEAEAMNEATFGGIEGLTSIVPRAGQKGFEIWVKDPTQAAPARQILAQRMAEVQAVKQDRESRTGTVVVVCPSCKESSNFPASQQGTVQECVHCHKYVDVPDPNDETDWPDDFDPSEYESE